MIEKGIKGFLLKNVIIYKVKTTDDTISFGVYHTVTCDVKSFFCKQSINFICNLTSLQTQTVYIEDDTLLINDAF